MENKEEILARLNTFNQQLTGMQREVMAMIAIMSAPEELPQVPAKPAEGTDGPTIEPKYPAELLMLRHLIGTGSLFATYLSPQIMKDAKGFMKPDPDKIPQYLEDVRTVSIGKLQRWPAGFYRNRETKCVQFFIKSDDYLVYLDLSPEYLLTPMVARLPLAENTAFVKVTDLLPAALEPLKEMIEKTLKTLLDIWGY